MKQLTKLLVFTLATIFTACGAPKTSTYKVISYNIRLLTPYDTDSLHWDARKPATIEMINQEKPDAFGLQEAVDEQVAYIEENCPQYVRVGVGRDDGDKAGEFMAVFYLRDRFELIDYSTIWLSETPDTVSMGWDAAYPRTATTVILRDKATDKEFAYINTHFDHKGKVARIESAKMVAERIAAIKAEGIESIVAGGDFNSRLEDSMLIPMQEALGYARSDSPVTDNKGTFNDWGRVTDGRVIDHFFYTGVTPKEYHTLDGNYGVPYISDHYPIAFTFEM